MDLQPANRFDAACASAVAWTTPGIVVHNEGLTVDRSFLKNLGHEATPPESGPAPGGRLADSAITAVRLPPASDRRERSHQARFTFWVLVCIFGDTSNEATEELP
jgi:hypothetical protein